MYQSNERTDVKPYSSRAAILNKFKKSDFQTRIKHTS